MRTLLPSLLLVVLAIAAIGAEETVPQAPAGQVLDQANVLLPEAAAKLSEKLVSARQQSSVYIYLVTVPSLDTSFANQVERLEALAKKYASQWISDQHGAAILFDDETGLVTVAYSKGAKDTFSELELDQTMKGPLSVIQRGGEKRDKILDRDKLERTTLLVVDTFKAFEEKAHRRQTKLWILFGGVALVVLASVGFELLIASGRRKAKPEGASEAVPEPHTPGNP